MINLLIMQIQIHLTLWAPTFDHRKCDHENLLIKTLFFIFWYYLHLDQRFESYFVKLFMDNFVSDLIHLKCPISHKFPMENWFDAWKREKKIKINNDDEDKNRIAACEEMGRDAAESIIKGSNLKTCQRSFAFDLFFCSSSATLIHMFLPTLFFFSSVL